MTTIAQDAKALRELQRARDEAKGEYEDAKDLYERAEVELIERMRNEECDSLKVDGTNFVPAETVYGQIQDRSEFVAWARDNDDELVEVKERKKLINELVRERLDNGEPLPPGVGHYVREYVSLRAG